MAKARDVVHLILKDTAITLDSESDHGVGLGYDGPIDEYVRGILTSCVCQQCQSPNVLLSLDGAEVVDVEPREMGSETYFTCKAWSDCSNCGTEVHVKYLFTEYASSWFYVEAEERTNCSPYVVGRLDFVARQIGHLIAETMPKEAESELDILTDISRTETWRILVEGRDDVLVLPEWLAKCGLRDGSDFVVSPGVHGGFESIVLTVRVLKRLQVAVPLLVVVDSDSSERAKLQQLEEGGVRTHETFIWPKKELDAYLCDAEALSAILKVPRREIEQFLTACQSVGKETLEALFHKYGLPSPKPEVKQLIARHIGTVPADVAALCARVRTLIGRPDATPVH